MGKIKPCPFCGNEKANADSFGNVFYVKCKGCNACWPDGKNEEEAITLWNAAPRKEDVKMGQNCGSCTDWKAKEPEPAPLTPSNSSGLKTLCEKAISKWGKAAQINKATEELLELATALTRYQNLNPQNEDYQEKAYKILDNIHEEREDVEIMLRQLDVIFGRSEEWRRKKYEHLRAIVKK